MYKPPLSSAAPYVPLDTILDSGRVLRRPLGEWLRHLVPILRSCTDATPCIDTMYEASAALNNAALIFVHAGLPGTAEELCHSQLAWVASLRAVLPEAELAVLAMQPWVNLGRLSRRAGNYECALRYFRELGTCRVGAKVKFGDWEAPVSRILYEAAEPIYVYESMRTYQQAHDLDHAIAFAHALDKPLLRSTAMLQTELLIQIHLQRREHEEVVSLTRAMPWPEDQYGVLARYFYTAAAFQAVEQRQSCAEILKRIRPKLRAYVERQDFDSRQIRLVLEACRLSAHLALHDLLPSMISLGCSLVLRAADVPFAVAILRLAGQHGCSPGVSELDRLEEFTSLSGYAVPSCNAPVQSLAGGLAALRSATSELFSASAHTCSA